jgi:hypothetical protein
MVDSTVYFDLPTDVRHAEVTEAELKSLAVNFQSSLRQRGFSVGEIFGSEDDLCGFSIDYGKYEMLLSAGLQMCRCMILAGSRQLGRGAWQSSSVSNVRCMRRWHLIFMPRG